jgi:hypothetical protein
LGTKTPLRCPRKRAQAGYLEKGFELIEIHTRRGFGPVPAIIPANGPAEYTYETGFARQNGLITVRHAVRRIQCAFPKAGVCAAI